MSQLRSWRAVLALLVLAGASPQGGIIVSFGDTIISPNGGETWIQGGSAGVSWKSNPPPLGAAALPPIALNVKIELSTDGGATFPVLLSDWVPDVGYRVVNVPAVMTTQARVRLTTSFGNQTTVSAGNFTITTGTPDTSPPTVAITSPTSASTYSTATTPIVLGGTASDDVGVVRVEWSTALGYSGGATGTTAWTASVPLVPGGGNLITITAWDASGKRGTATITVTYTGVADQPPTVSITSPLTGASFLAPASITIDVSASDSDGTVTQVDFYQGTTLLGSSTTAPYQFTWNSVAAGTYDLTAKATDNGGFYTISLPVTVTVTGIVGAGGGGGAGSCGATGMEIMMLLVCVRLRRSRLLRATKRN
jgi:hypothetical protein